MRLVDCRQGRGSDAEDPTTLRAGSPECLAGIDGGVRGLRVGLDAQYLRRDVQPELADAVLAVADVLEGLGARRVAVRVPPFERVLAAWPVLCAAEAAQAHAATFPSRARDYGPGFRAFLERGAALRAVEYAAAHAEREVFAGELHGVFEDADLLLCPSMASVAPPLALFDLHAPWDDAALPTMRYTAPFDMSRNPCLALPCGFVDGLPASAQLVGRHGEEALLCRAGYAYESATPWHERHPDV